MSWSQIAFLSLGFTDLLLCKLCFYQLIWTSFLGSPVLCALPLWGSWLTSHCCLCEIQVISFQVSFQWSCQFSLGDDTIDRHLRCQAVGYCNIFVIFYQNEVGKENLSTASLRLNNSALPLSFSCSHLTLISPDSSLGTPTAKTFHGPRALAMHFLGFVFFLLKQISA